MTGSGLSPVNYVNCTIADRSIMHLLGISKTQIEVDGYLTSQFWCLGFWIKPGSRYLSYMVSHLCLQCFSTSGFSLSLCIDHLGRLSYLFLLLFFRTLHSDVYIFPFLFCLSLLFFSRLFVKTSSDIHFALLHFYYLGMVLITTSYTVLWISIHSSSGTLSIRSNFLNIFVTFSV